MPDLATETVGNLVGLIRAAAPAGFATALHIRFTAPTFLFLGYPAAWSEEYTTRGLHMQDPNVMWGLMNTGWIRWSELARQDPAGVIAAAARQGMSFGVACSVLRGDTRSVAGFARADREYTDEEIAELEGLLIRLHDTTAGSDSLSPRAMAALKSMSVRMTHG